VSAASFLKMSDLFTEKVGEEPKGTSNASDTEVVADSFSEKAEQATEQFSDEQYPQGLKLIALAGASLSAVFLIALDQVWTSAFDIFCPVY
jgi:hypothetical protein